MNNEALKPCPFCGYAITACEAICEKPSDDDDAKPEFTGMCCPSCAVFVPKQEDNQTARDGIRIWNQRFTSSGISQIEDAVRWCLDLDQRNGSLPKTYAERLRAALSEPAQAVGVKTSIDTMREGALELFKKSGWEANSRLAPHQVIELMSAFGMRVYEGDVGCGYPDCGCCADAACDDAIKQHSDFRSALTTDKAEEPFPQPRRKGGGEPCGECHIQPGETCDICGAINKAPLSSDPTPSSLKERVEKEIDEAISDYLDTLVVNKDYGNLPTVNGIRQAVSKGICAALQTKTGDGV